MPYPFFSLSLSLSLSLFEVGVTNPSRELKLQTPDYMGGFLGLMSVHVCEYVTNEYKHVVMENFHCA